MLFHSLALFQYLVVGEGGRKKNNISRLAQAIDWSLVVDPWWKSPKESRGQNEKSKGRDPCSFLSNRPPRRMWPGPFYKHRRLTHDRSYPMSGVETKGLATQDRRFHSRFTHTHTQLKSLCEIWPIAIRCKEHTTPLSDYSFMFQMYLLNSLRLDSLLLDVNLPPSRMLDKHWHLQSRRFSINVLTNLFLLSFHFLLHHWPKTMTYTRRWNAFGRRRNLICK